VHAGRTSLGRVLVDAHGRTLYLFSADRAGHSRCTGACVRLWPALTTAAPALAGPGVKASLLGVAQGPSGALIATYGGHPLYRFAHDAGPGQTRGEEAQAFGGRWDAISLAGKAVRPPAAPAPASAPTSVQTSATAAQQTTSQSPASPSTQPAQTRTAAPVMTSTTTTSSSTHAPSSGGIPQNNGGDQDSDNNGGPSDGDGNV
jgi:predicted lipoprotein with Yx(FWY)xxD motif